MTVAEFYRLFRVALRELEIRPLIWPVPVEITGGIPFKEDTQHKVYDPVAVERLHQLLLSGERVLDQYRARFCVKCSPVLVWRGTSTLRHEVQRRERRRAMAPTALCAGDEPRGDGFGGAGR